MKPIPVAFHIGPLEIHTYGIGLAITFWFAYRYFAKRLRDHGYPEGWLGRTFVWIIVASIVGARAASVISNWSQYAHDLPGVFAVWHGGLSSFGGLALGVPAGLICARKWCPQLRLPVALDLVAPVLVVAWSIGRLFGPQVMWQGGGRETTAWYGMYYAGQVGRRIPVPILQAIECFVIYLLALWVERWIARRGGPLGIVVTATVTLYGLSRFDDEYVFLSHGARGDIAVEWASIAFVLCGIGLGVWLLWRDHARVGHRMRSAQLPERGGPDDPWAAPRPAPVVAEGALEDSPDSESPAVPPSDQAQQALTTDQDPVPVEPATSPGDTV